MKRSNAKGQRRTASCSRSYPLERSPFYRLERQADLAKLLQLNSAKLRWLIRERTSLYSEREELVGTKVRSLSVPTRDMRRCHERIYHLLRRIQLPDFIMCPRRKTGPADNALLHRGNRTITSFDIRAFYPSTTDKHIFEFFRKRLQMSPDCSRLMALLCSHNGRLPLGSPMSPHLACLVHLDLFEEATVRAEQLGYRTTVWVDDVTISGPTHRRDIVAMIARKAASKGLEIHKLRRGGARRGVELTGSYIRRNRVAPSNTSHIRIRDLTDAYREESTPAAKYALLSRLAAMARHQRMILRRAGESTMRIDGRLQFYRREMIRVQEALSVTEPTVTSVDIDPTSPAF